MATRNRKTRKLRGSRTHGWGQVGQHRASGHKGGLGASGQLKHHFSSMLKFDPDHFGHESTHTPRNPHPIKRWASVRDLDDMFALFGTGAGSSMEIDLGKHKYDKLLGGGSVSGAYHVTVYQSTKTAAKKIQDAGGKVITTAKTSGQKQGEAQPDNG